jgi:hypothetical protein
VSRALRETETKTEIDRFSINLKPIVGRLSKISVFGFSRFCNSGRFSLIGYHFSDFVTFGGLQSSQPKALE